MCKMCTKLTRTLKLICFSPNLLKFISVLKIPTEKYKMADNWFPDRCLIGEFFLKYLDSTILLLQYCQYELRALSGFRQHDREERLRQLQLSGPSSRWAPKTTLVLYALNFWFEQFKQFFYISNLIGTFYGFMFTSAVFWPVLQQLVMRV